MVYTRLRVILVARRLDVPFLLYVVLHVIYRTYVVAVHTSVLPTANTANTANVWGSIALLVLEVYHRVQTDEYDAVLTYRYLFLYTR